MPTNSQTDLIKSILQNHRGFSIGEIHQERASLKFLIDNMKTLREEEVKILGLEIFKTEWSKHDLDLFNRGETSENLKDRIAFLDLKYAAQSHPAFEGRPIDLKDLKEKYFYWKNNRNLTQDSTVKMISEMLTSENHQSYNYQKLLTTAYNHGIELIPIDSSALNTDDYAARIAAMDNYAVQKIKEYPANTKFITLTGVAHTKGISDALQVPDIHIVQGQVERIMQDQPVRISNIDFKPKHFIILNSKEKNTEQSPNLESSATPETKVSFHNTAFITAGVGLTMIAGGAVSAVHDRNNAQEKSKALSFRTVALCVVGAVLTGWAAYMKWGPTNQLATTR
jgi:hypothetical protein